MNCPVCNCEHLVYTEHRPANVLPWFNFVFLIAALLVNGYSPLVMSDEDFAIQLGILVLDIIFNVLCVIFCPKSRTKATCPECGWYLINK